MRSDVIVVGAGGAGLAASIEAAEAGATVLLVEKNGSPGGSTAWSIGSVTATRTPHQRRKGIVDTPVHHWEDMVGFAAGLDHRDNPELRRVLCEDMPETFQWLLDSGIRFYGPMPEPPHRQPRMHNVLPNSRSFIYHLERRACRAGVRLSTGTEVIQLLCEGGKVAGIVCRQKGQTEELRSRAVVLAAGDFTGSARFKSRFMGEQEANVEAVNATATGDGQMLAESVGASIVNGDLALGPELRFIAPVKETFIRRLPPWPLLAGLMELALERLPPVVLRPLMMKFLTTALAPAPRLFEDGAILVNARGERFCDELDRPALRLPDQPRKVGYIVLDRRLAELYREWPRFISTAPGIAYAYLDDYRRNRRDVFTTGATPEQLAVRLGMDSSKLHTSIQADRLRTPDGRSQARSAPPLGAGPYVALGPVRAVFVHSEGGLRVDLEHRVLGAEGQPVPGLYAAGSTGQGGLLLRGHGHHLAWAFVSGRRAGRLAAQFARAAEPARGARMQASKPLQDTPEALTLNGATGRSCDVLVIGGGNAALSAALAAREQGASVLILESAPRAFRGGNSRHTRNMRIAHDEPHSVLTGSYPEEEYWRDLLQVTEGQTDEHLARLTIRGSADGFRFMQAHGARFQPSLSGTLSLSRTNGFFLGGGKALVNAYYLAAERLGIDVLYDSEVTSLHLERDEVRQVDAIIRGFGEIISARAVVVASGGYQANIDWLEQGWGAAARNFLIRGTPYAQGRVLRNLLDQGVASIGDPTQCHAVAIDGRSPRFDGGIVTRLDCVPFSIVVDREGRRFYDEGQDVWPKRYAIWGRLVAQAPGQIAYSIFDAKAQSLFMPSAFPAVRAETIEELAIQLGLSPTALRQTVDRYNAAVRPGRFNSQELDGCRTESLEPPKSNWARRIDTPPYMGYPLKPGITFTYLGVKVDEHAHVYRTGGESVRNLFAAGEIMAGSILGKGYLAGFGMAIGTVFGRIAGRGAAAAVLRQ